MSHEQVPITCFSTEEIVTNVSNVIEANGYAITNGTVIMHELANLKELLSAQEKILETLAANMDSVSNTSQKMTEGVGVVGDVSEYLKELVGELASNRLDYGNEAHASEKAEL